MDYMNVHKKIAILRNKCYNCYEKNMTEEMINILFVDDDADYFSVIKHQLRPFQNKRFEITWVNSGEKALEKINSGAHFDLILLDYYLPNSNGVEVVKRIFNEKIEIPMILLTSNKDFRIAIEAMRYGVEDYLIKEEVVDTILPRAVLNVLERVHLNKRLAEFEKEKMLTHERVEAIQELIVTMCHEFNNPLAAIKISTDILMRQTNSDQQKEILSKLNNNILHLEKQIVKLRDLKIEKQQ